MRRESSLRGQAVRSQARSKVTLDVRCEQLEASIIELRRQREMDEHRELFRTRREQIQGALKRLQPLYKVMQLFRTEGIAVEEPTKSAAINHAKISKIRQAFLADAAYLADQAVLTDEIKWLHKWADTLEEKLESGWKAYVEQQNVGVKDAVLKVLGQIPKLSGTVESIRTLRDQISQSADVIPKTPQEIEVLRSRVNKVRDLWRSLDADNLPPGVLKFLQAAGDVTGAPLSSLTPEVQTWLRERKIEGSFHIHTA